MLLSYWVLWCGSDLASKIHAHVSGFWRVIHCQNSSEDWAVSSVLGVFPPLNPFLLIQRARLPWVVVEEWLWAPKRNYSEASDAFVIHCLNGFHFSPLQVVKQETASHQEEPEGVLQEPCPTSLIALSQKSWPATLEGGSLKECQSLHSSEVCCSLMRTKLAGALGVWLWLLSQARGIVVHWSFRKVGTILWMLLLEHLQNQVGPDSVCVCVHEREREMIKMFVFWPDAGERQKTEVQSHLLDRFLVMKSKWWIQTSTSNLYYLLLASLNCFIEGAGRIVQKVKSREAKRSVSVAWFIWKALTQAEMKRVPMDLQAAWKRPFQTT